MHPIRFGLAVTPTADPAELARARRADQLGLDLLAVQDHPYQPDHLEMWTYLTHLAANTQHVSLMPDVADLSLRSPTLLAKAAASLDVLSGGRVELGLGAGGIPQAIEAFGGPPRTPGERVDATLEALAVIRTALDATGRANVIGRFHHARGYSPGPAPAHDIGLWIGAQRPRLLRAIGAHADGWISPLNIYVAPTDVPAARDQINRGAHDAGRDPARLRRIYNVIGTIDGTRGPGLNGTASQWADTLADWHDDLAFDTFVFWPATDPDDQLERFARDVIPEVRTRVG
jgi:alkanesulfonate monooxygenase SsuD/methylene tetrahydromethanopterin reductase-like flavin-dependent oxidoreductase (luciferase family)